MIATYIQNPVIVDACQWTGDNVEEIKKFVTPIAEYLEDENAILVHTSDGDVKAFIGDYIIKNDNDEFYVCGRYVFEETYNIVEND